VITGKATLNGGLVVVNALPGQYAGGLTFLILNANEGRTGIFNGVELIGIGRNAGLLYQGDKVLVVTALFPSELIAAATSFNEKSVVDILTSPNLPAGLQTVYSDILLQTQVDGQQGLRELSGAIYPSLLSYARNNALLNGQYLIDQLSDTLERPKGINNSSNPDDPQPSDWNAWLRFLGATAANANSREVSGLNSTSEGLLVGMDRWFGDTTRVGFYGEYDGSQLNAQRLNESANLYDYNFGVTASQTLDQFYIIGFAGYAYDHYTTDRTISFTYFYNATNTAAFSGNLANVGFEAGDAINFGNWRLLPLVGFQFLSISNNAVSENGAGATNLSTSGLSGQDAWSSLGARFTYSTTIDNMSFGARGSVRYIHDFLGETPDAVMQFAGGGNPFTVMGARMGTNFCWAGLGVSFGYREIANAFIDFNALTSNKESIFMGSGGVELRW
jgi:uncharacterized protein with beta-barrel porin domain